MKRLLILVVLLTVAATVVAVPSHAQSGPTFYYVVTAVTADGFESVFSNQATSTFTQGKHITNLAWVASTSTVVGYNVYRATVNGGPYAKINAAPVTGVAYVDTFVLPNAPSGLAATQQ